MEIYLAGGGREIWRKWDFYQFNRLESFYYILKEGRGELIPKYDNFLLDSGAFTFMNKNKGNVNWDNYINNYANFINKYDVKCFFELDIDVIVGINEVERLRKKLESLTNKQCIPVFHKSRGKQYWFKIIKEYDYVAIGGIVTKEIRPKEYPFLNWFLSEAKKNDCKVHGLGFTRVSELHKYPFYSVDSTSWISGNRFGHVYLFKNGQMPKIQKKAGQRVKGNNVCEHNFKEWIKFAKYAKTNL